MLRWLPCCNPSPTLSDFDAGAAEETGGAREAHRRGGCGYADGHASRSLIRNRLLASLLSHPGPVPRKQQSLPAQSRAHVRRTVACDRQLGMTRPHDIEPADALTLSRTTQGHTTSCNAQPSSAGRRGWAVQSSSPSRRSLRRHPEPI
jgi:hypothetical protein